MKFISAEKNDRKKETNSENRKLNEKLVKFSSLNYAFPPRNVFCGADLKKPEKRKRRKQSEQFSAQQFSQTRRKSKPLFFTIATCGKRIKLTLARM